MTDTLTRSALDEYANLDLSPGSPAHESLFNRAREKVSADRTIKLHEGVGTHVGLTPAMDTWAERWIFPTRIAAVREVCAAYQADQTERLGGSRRAAVGGRFVPMEREHVERDWMAQRVALIDDFHNSNDGLSREKDETERAYEAMRMAEGGREPVRTDWKYPAALVGIVVVEGLINFDSLSKVPYLGTPALAFGATLVVALGVGMAAHLHGMLLKQWTHFFDSGHDQNLKHGLQLAAFSTFLLTTALAFIGYSRYFLLLPAIQEAVAMGEAPPSVIVSVGASVLTNAIVWGVGVAISFFCHDSNPEYPKKHKRAIEASAKLEAMRRSKMDHPFAQAEARKRRELEQLSSFEKGQANSNNVDRNHSMLARLRAADARVIGLLKEYKQSFVESCREKQQEPRFTIFDPVPDRRDHQREIDAEEFLRHPVSFRLEVR